jgi:integrase
MARLSALKVSKISKQGMYSDGAGLYLQVTATSAKSWVYRFTLYGRAREMGLGSFNVYSLAEAREKAAAARKLKSDGIDPIEHRNAQRTAARLEVAKAITFAECATAYIAAHEAGWKNAKHRYQWRQTIDSYINPTIGKLPVSAVDTGLVLKLLQKIWLTKPETAGRVRSRIENILGWATVREFRSGDNPARWRGHLDQLLAPQNKVRKVEHHPAMPYEDVSAFIAELRKQNGIAAQALEFVILTASRTGEAINAKWGEIDMSAKIFAVPADRMKSGRPHRIPLSVAAIAILNSLRPLAPIKAGSPDPDAPIFASGKRGVPISNMAMLQLLRRMGHSDTTVHGYRSTFRDWARECTNFPRDIAEEALSHVLSDKTEAAYRRGDALEKRRLLMDAWAKFATAAPKAKPSPASGRLAA